MNCVFPIVIGYSNCPGSFGLAQQVFIQLNNWQMKGHPIFFQVMLESGKLFKLESGKLFKLEIKNKTKKKKHSLISIKMKDIGKKKN